MSECKLAVRVNKRMRLQLTLEGLDGSTGGGSSVHGGGRGVFVICVPEARHARGVCNFDMLMLSSAF